MAAKPGIKGYARSIVYKLKILNKNMATNFIFPQQIELHYMIPSIRKELAIAMKESGSSQREIAEKLMVTEPAVSQYFSEKRATTVEFNDKVKNKIKEAAKKINSNNFQAEMQNLLKMTLHENATCGVCRDITNASHSCKVCFDK